MSTATIIPSPTGSTAGADRPGLMLPRRLDVHEVAPLRARLDRLGLRPGQLVTVDGSAVTHADRAGLAVLVEARERAEAAGADIVLWRASTTLRIAMELTGQRRAPRRDDADLPVALDREAA